LYKQLTNGVVKFNIYNTESCPNLSKALQSFLAPYFWSTEGLEADFNLILKKFEEIPDYWINHPAEEVIIRKSTADIFNLSGRFFFLDDGTRVVIDESTQTAYHIDEERNIVNFYGSKHSEIHLFEFVRYVCLLLEEISGTMILHASATSYDEAAYLVLGSKGAGKTSTLLNLIFRHGHEYFSGDKLLVSRDNEGIIVRGWPDYPHVGIGTLRNFPQLVKGLELSLKWPNGLEKADSHKELFDPLVFRNALPSVTSKPSVRKVSTMLFPCVALNNSSISQLTNNDERVKTLLDNIEYPHQFLTVKWHNLFKDTRKTTTNEYEDLIEYLLDSPWFRVTGKSGIPTQLLKEISNGISIK